MRWSGVQTSSPWIPLRILHRFKWPLVFICSDGVHIDQAARCQGVESSPSSGTLASDMNGVLPLYQEIHGRRLLQERTSRT